MSDMPAENMLCEIEYSYELDRAGNWAYVEGNSTVISPLDKEGRISYRNMIEDFHAAMKEFIGSERGDADTINDKHLKEHFVGGAYIRELLIPAGTTMVSELWNKDRLWIIAYGDVTITTESGKKRIRGTHTEVPLFGSRVALYAHKDTLWFAITGAKSDSSECVKKELIVSDHSKLKYPWDMIEGD